MVVSISVIMWCYTFFSLIYFSRIALCLIVESDLVFIILYRFVNILPPGFLFSDSVFQWFSIFRISFYPVYRHCHYHNIVKHEISGWLFFIITIVYFYNFMTNPLLISHILMKIFVFKFGVYTVSEHVMGKNLPYVFCQPLQPPLSETINIFLDSGIHNSFYLS